MSNQGKGKSIWKNYRFPILLIGSIVVGSVIGMVMGEKATVLKPFGRYFSEPDVHGHCSSGVLLLLLVQ